MLSRALVSLRASANGAKAISAACRNHPSQTLSPSPFSPTRFMPSFQSPAPISGSPCRPTARLASSATAQCSKRVTVSRETVGRKNDLSRLRSSCAPSRNGINFVKHEHVLRRLDVLSDRVCQPSAIVGYARPNALTGLRQPPVLHVALSELARGRAQQMFARQIRPGCGERHAVLQLVAKTVGAAGLIERRARPNTACERLVEQPAIEHEVHRAVRRLDLDRAQSLIPAACDVRLQGVEIGCANGYDRGAGILACCGLSQKEDDFGRAPPAAIPVGCASRRRDPRPRQPCSTAATRSRARPDSRASGYDL